MKLYWVNNTTFVGTQAEAKKAAKEAGNGQWIEVEVPTDKPSLIEYLNNLVASRDDTADEYTTVVERQDPPVERGPSHTEQSIAIDDAWEALPLARKLHFAAMAMEDARELFTSAANMLD